MLTNETRVAQITHQIQALVNQLEDENDVVITVEQVPLRPLRMGHYETVVSVREKVKK